MSSDEENVMKSQIFSGITVFLCPEAISKKRSELLRELITKNGGCCEFVNKNSVDYMLMDRRHYKTVAAYGRFDVLEKKDKFLDVQWVSDCIRRNKCLDYKKYQVFIQTKHSGFVKTWYNERYYRSSEPTNVFESDNESSEEANTTFDEDCYSEESSCDDNWICVPPVNNKILRGLINTSLSPPDIFKTDQSIESINKRGNIRISLRWHDPLHPEVVTGLPFKYGSPFEIEFENQNPFHGLSDNPISGRHIPNGTIMVFYNGDADNDSTQVPLVCNNGILKPFYVKAVTQNPSYESTQSVNDSNVNDTGQKDKTLGEIDDTEVVSEVNTSSESSNQSSERIFVDTVSNSNNRAEGKIADNSNSNENQSTKHIFAESESKDIEIGEEAHNSNGNTNESSEYIFIDSESENDNIDKGDLDYTCNENVYKTTEPISEVEKTEKADVFEEIINELSLCISKSQSVETVNVDTCKETVKESTQCISDSEIVEKVSEADIDNEIINNSIEFLISACENTKRADNSIECISNDLEFENDSKKVQADTRMFTSECPLFIDNEAINESIEFLISECENTKEVKVTDAEDKSFECISTELQFENDDFKKVHAATPTFTSEVPFIIDKETINKSIDFLISGCENTKKDEATNTYDKSVECISTELGFEIDDFNKNEAGTRALSSECPFLVEKETMDESMQFSISESENTKKVDTTDTFNKFTETISTEFEFEIDDFTTNEAGTRAFSSECPFLVEKETMNKSMQFSISESENTKKVEVTENTYNKYTDCISMEMGFENVGLKEIIEAEARTYPSECPFLTDNEPSDESIQFLFSESENTKKVEEIDIYNKHTACVSTELGFENDAFRFPSEYPSMGAVNDEISVCENVQSTSCVFSNTLSVLPSTDHMFSSSSHILSSAYHISPSTSSTLPSTSTADLLAQTSHLPMLVDLEQNEVNKKSQEDWREKLKRKKKRIRRKIRKHNRRLRRFKRAAQRRGQGAKYNGEEWNETILSASDSDISSDSDVEIECEIEGNVNPLTPSVMNSKHLQTDVKQPECIHEKNKNNRTNEEVVPTPTRRVTRCPTNSRITKAFRRQIRSARLVFRQRVRIDKNIIRKPASFLKLAPGKSYQTTPSKRKIHQSTTDNKRRKKQKIMHAKDNVNGSVKDNANGSVKDSANGLVNDSASGSAKDNSNGYAKENANLSAKESCNGSVKENAKKHALDNADCYVKDSGNGCGKDSGNGYGKDSANGYGKDSANGYGKDSANGYTKDNANNYAKVNANRYSLDNASKYPSDSSSSSSDEKNSPNEYSLDENQNDCSDKSQNECSDDSQSHYSLDESQSRCSYEESQSQCSFEESQSQCSFEESQSECSFNESQCSLDESECTSDKSQNLRCEISNGATVQAHNQEPSSSYNYPSGMVNKKNNTLMGNIIEQLELLYTTYRNAGLTWRKIIYAGAIASLLKYEKRVESFEDIPKLMFVSRSISSQIWQIVQHGSPLPVVSEVCTLKWVKTIKSLKKLWGVGPRKAHTFYKTGIFSIEDLRKANVPRPILIALRYHPSVKKRIPLDAANDILKKITEVVSEVNKKVSCEAGSSIRRKKKIVGVISLLITLPQNEDDLNHYCVLAEIVETLHEKGLLVDDLVKYKTSDGQTEYAGIYQNCKASKIEEKYRIVKLVVATRAAAPFAMLHLTGPSYFVKALHQWARKHDSVLTKDGLHVKSLSESDDMKAIPLTVPDEASIFAVLQLPLRNPEEREFVKLGTLF